MMKFFSRFRKDEKGATAIEYGLIAALIAVGIITATATLGTSISSTFKTVSDKLDSAKAN
ncbi:pilus assembly protein Flp/PilA [Ochrobactrum sp. 19YEA23]|uniref:Flp family type IVb pilin n=1 Tax=Ochrobactrum sp. 19YEA23 TaxID=3039854 RepID=UPI00247A8625|nr:pilus assembly protein Flp/PilA [Ochrobactrum sp. 19YEA23]